MNNTKHDRYFVDERVGCIAVRDSNRTDPNYPGLHRDTLGVVQYWHGNKVSEKCPTCGHELTFKWEVPESLSAAAKELCERLNSECNNQQEGTTE